MVRSKTLSSFVFLLSMLFLFSSCSESTKTSSKSSESLSSSSSKSSGTGGDGSNTDPGSSSFSMYPSPLEVELGESVLIVPTVNGLPILSYSIASNLPSGLSFSSATGTISGTSQGNVGPNSGYYSYTITGSYIDNLGAQRATSSNSQIKIHPITPANSLSAQSMSTTSIDLTFTSQAKSPGNKTYEIFKRIKNSGSFSLHTSIVKNLSPGQTHKEVLSGLQSNQTYEMYVITKNSYGVSLASQTIEAKTQAQGGGSAPDAPTNLKALEKDKTVILSWDAMQGATQYIVKLNTSNGYVDLQTGLTTPTYTHSNLTNGTTYQYAVYAVNSNGWNSSGISATPVTKPLAPQNLVSSGGDRSVTLSWSLNQNASNKVKRIQVKRKNQAGGYDQVGSDLAPTVTTFTDSGLTNGTQYHYNVYAINDAGYTASGVYGTAGVVDPPLAPKNLTAAAGDKKITLNWSAPSGTDPRVERYQVKRKNSDGVYVQVGSDLPASAVTFTDSGLTNGTQYHYVVYAINIAGYRGSSISAIAEDNNPRITLSLPEGFSFYKSELFLNTAGMVPSLHFTSDTNFSTVTGSTYTNFDPNQTTFLTTNNDITLTVTDSRNRSATEKYSFKEVDFVPEKIAVGESHACTINKDSTVSCWGLNSFGQLGNDSKIDSKIPVKVQNLSDVIDITAGYSHTCALKNNGKAYCWGENSSGKLGNGSNLSSSTPVLVSTNTLFSEISAGLDHTCALSTDHKGYCWGDNRLGTLGNSSNTNSNVPIQVPGITDITNISAGGDHTCAVVGSSFSAYCWGAFQYNSAGNASLSYNSPKPMYLTEVSEISSGGSHTCALTLSGSLYCWGRNNYGQIADSSLNNRTTPFEVKSINNVKDISAGKNHTCALDDQSNIYCWGENLSRQLGNSDFSQDYTSSPMKISHLKKIKQVSAGGKNTCALDHQNNAFCWRRIGNFGEDQIPVEVVKHSSVIKLSVGYLHTCILPQDGKPHCWGKNNYGQLGNGNNYLFSDTPIQVKDLTTITDISSGGGHTCAVNSYGYVYCWGQNQFGQLGEGSGTNRSVFYKAINLTNVLNVSTGLEHTCAVKNDGNLFCWGNNSNGQLGIGSNLTMSIPSVVVSNSAFFIQVSSGAKHSCATTIDGKAYCWGQNQFGQLGDGTTNESWKPVLVSGIQDVSEIHAGAKHTCALIKNGSVYCWGNNDYGQLGNQSTTATNTPVLLDRLSSIKSLTAGTYHNCSISSTNEVNCWGDNTYRQLGSGRNDPLLTVPTLVEGLSNPKQISAGDMQTCAVTADGKDYCWGLRGYLGNTRIQKSVPYYSEFFKGLFQINQ